MIVARTIRDCRLARESLGSLALVPTMGALHAGHLSLIEHGKRQAPHVAVTIFVNPTQFGPHEDFHRYPRPLEDDLAQCEASGADLVFVPSVEEIYPEGALQAAVDVPALTTVLEGAFRPGHFAGVCQVVAKLFNITQPQFACFGQKDFQQLAVLKAMTRALDFPITIVPCPTLRDPDGLAMSSRNRYLSHDQRQRALSINRSLFHLADRAKAGETDPGLLRNRLVELLADARGLESVPTHLDYATIIDRATLEERTTPINTWQHGAQAVVAMRVGTTRLIDNLPLTD